MQKLQEAHGENERLRKILAYSEALSGHEIAARVVGINPGPIETDRLKARLAVIAKEDNVDDGEARRGRW